VRVTTLRSSGQIYTCNSYYVTGSWNRLDDRNTIVDVGCDPAVIQSLEATYSGVGKHKVDQVVLTHSHYDHGQLLEYFAQTYAPTVYAANAALPFVNRFLKGGEILLLGDAECEVLATPGHSSDSVCLYCPADGVLFAGDTPLIINTTEGTYEPGYIDSLERIAARNIQTIYFGHGEPLFEKCKERLQFTLENVHRSRRS
jgi:glyoxylase-like metal-dependent hydrolase (beta-lactamase superfamily II)